MDDEGSAASIILFAVLLLVDIFCYGFGAALTFLNEKEVERRAGEEKDKRSIRLKKIIGNPAEYANTLQLVTTLVNVLIGANHFRLLLGLIQGGLIFLVEGRAEVSPAAARVFLSLAAVFATLLILYITLALGVLLPKKVAARMPDKWAYACVNPVYLVTRLLSPFMWLVTVTVKGILKLAGAGGDAAEADVTEEEIIHMVNEGHEQGVIEASEAEMISNIFELGDKEAQNIMTHRNQVVGVDAGMTLENAIAFMLAGTNSRYPVYEGNIDHIIGILHLKDALRFQGAGEKRNVPLRELEGLMREPCFVPQTKNINELFREMQAAKRQMVVVVDEYGQTDGLLAMEDILEEIVGNILDEYDVESRNIEECGDDKYVVSGITPLEELEEYFGLSFENEEVETLNGFLISRMDRIPEPDEKFHMEYRGFHFKVLTVENKMIQSVLVTKLSEQAGESWADDPPGVTGQSET